MRALILFLCLAALAAAPAAAQAPQRSLSDVALNGETTLRDVEAAWGPAFWTGPGRFEFVSYWLSTEMPEQELWLSFSREEPRRLTRAILFTGPGPGRRERTVLFDGLRPAVQRRGEQLPCGRELSPAEVYSAWGPPDDEGGSGIAYWGYEMADGSWSSLVFFGRPPDYAPRLLAARCRRQSGRR